MKTSPAGLTASLGVVALAVAAAYVVVGSIAFMVGGRDELLLAAAAAAACLLGAAAALVFPRMLGARLDAVSGVLVPMALRMVVPLLFFVSVRMARPELAGIGLALYLVAFYTTTLAVETWIALGQKDQSTPGKP